MSIKEDWNVEDIYKNEAEFEEDLEKIRNLIPKIQEFKGKLYNNSKMILELERLSSYMSEIQGKISGYSYLCYAQNMLDESAIVRYKKVEALFDELSKASYFIVPELSKMDEEDFKKMMEEEPELKEHKLSYDILLENKKHVLEESQEQILATYGQAFGGYSEVYDILTNTEFKYNKIVDKDGNEHELTDSNYSLYLDSEDNVLRRNAFKEIYRLYKGHINTISEIFLRDVKIESVSVKNRKYNSSLEAAVKSDESTIKVYNTLVESVNKNLGLNHEYIKFKKDILKKYLNTDEFHIYDIYVNPYTKELERQNIADKHISINKAKDTVVEALKPLGDEYLEVVDRAFKEGWIDIYPKENKERGAFSMGIYGVHPYIMLNHVGTQNDVSTLAHELGHTMHSYYANTTQKIYHADYTIMVAEVASTVNEILLAEHLIRNEKDKLKKKMLLKEHIDGIRATLIRQTMFAEFEQNIHSRSENEEILTNTDLDKTYFDLVKKYFGDDIILDSEIESEWARVPHFYRSYYVYKYATGITSAIYIAHNILEKGEEYRDKYIEMLKTGGKIKSLDVLKIADVDLEDPKIYEDAFKYLKEKIDELIQLENE